MGQDGDVNEYADTREHVRRSRDVKVETFIDRLIKWTDRPLRLWAVLGAVAGFAGAVGTTITLYIGLPSRIGTLETKVDSGFQSIEGRFQASDRRQAVRDSSDAITQEKLDLLLAMGCPGQRQAFIARMCRPYLTTLTPR